MDKNKKFTVWRIAGIVVLCLVVIGGIVSGEKTEAGNGKMAVGMAWGFPSFRSW